MDLSFLRIILALTSVWLCSCTPNGDGSLLEEIQKQEDKTDVVEEPCDTIDPNLFNPYYKPFYKGLTMKKVFESLNHHDPIISSTASGPFESLNHYDPIISSTASGPGNPLKIDCYPDYSDSGTGIYYYHFFDLENNEFGIVQINVSLSGEGFWMGDTTQRINSIFIRGRCEQFDQLLPLRKEGLRMLLEGQLEKIDKNLYGYSEEDYRFWYLTQNSRIDAVLIERVYCNNDISPPAEIQNLYKLNNR